MSAEKLNLFSPGCYSAFTVSTSRKDSKITAHRLLSAHLIRAALLLAVAACGLALPAEAAAVRGQVFDAEGEPLEGVLVGVFEREDSGGGLFGSRRKAPEKVRVATDRTDSQGLFEIELGAREFRGDVLVGCVPDEGWDRLRHALPEPRDVGRDLRRGGDVAVTFRVEDAPGWRELAREIERVGGPDSKRGKILRKRGHPPDRLITLDGREEWRYPGVTFVFEQGELVEIRRDSQRAAQGRASGGDA